MTHYVMISSVISVNQHAELFLMTDDSSVIEQ